MRRSRPVAAQVPVISAEFGENDCAATHVNSFMDWADQRGVGYLMWAGGSCRTPIARRSRCSPTSRGTLARANGTAFKAHLARLAPRVSLGGAKTQALDAR